MSFPGNNSGNHTWSWLLEKSINKGFKSDILICWWYLAFHGGYTYVVRKRGSFRGVELLQEAADYIAKVSVHTDESFYYRTARDTFCMLVQIYVLIDFMF